MGLMFELVNRSINVPVRKWENENLGARPPVTARDGPDFVWADRSKFSWANALRC